jgi:hypothetical protein
MNRRYQTRYSKLLNTFWHWHRVKQSSCYLFNSSLFQHFQ